MKTNLSYYIAQHDVYHIGQIGLVLALIRAKTPATATI
jgi:uncharacterized damage-inducible protein DinB